jgi:sulfite reductase (ferredoxin)
MPVELSEEIDIFNSRWSSEAGKIDEKVFAETRLRRGIPGNYDNGQRRRQTDPEAQTFADVIKPRHAVDAPGMMRIKIPFGGSTGTAEALAELSEEYADGVSM